MPGIGLIRGVRGRWRGVYGGNAAVDEDAEEIGDGSGVLNVEDG